MRKKLLVTILSVSLLATGLIGCGNTKSGEQAESAEVETEQENQRAVGIWESGIANLGRGGKYREFAEDDRQL